MYPFSNFRIVGGGVSVPSGSISWGASLERCRRPIRQDAEDVWNRRT